VSDTENSRASVKIPKDLYLQIQKAIEGKGFATVDDYVTYFLRVSFGKKPGQAIDSDDAAVIERLKALGYV
jgi:Arc/MetJ-type ribon-helix-helix transcriptional regulator